LFGLRGFSPPSAFSLAPHGRSRFPGIAGVVRDNQQAVIAGAKVLLVSSTQGFQRETQTNAEGVFSFASVQPGTYVVSVESAGFKKFEQRDVKIYASDRYEVPVTMEVGSVSETITVESESVQVQTTGAERAAVLTGKQVVDLALVGRDFISLVRVTPGVVFTGGLGGIQSNGNRGNQNNLLLDGVTNVDTGSTS